jgi:hypothetical protein
MSKNKLIQITNQQVGNVAANTFMPLGRVTRRINATTTAATTFTITSAESDTIYLNEPGYYKITYSLSALAGAAGIIEVTLVANGVDIYSASETAAAEGDTVNITLPYVVRVCPNCCASPANCPMAIQFELGDVAITGSVANAIIEKIQ